MVTVSAVVHEYGRTNYIEKSYFSSSNLEGCKVPEEILRDIQRYLQGLLPEITGYFSRYGCMYLAFLQKAYSSLFQENNNDIDFCEIHIEKKGKKAVILEDFINARINVDSVEEKKRELQEILQSLFCKEKI